MSYHHKLHIIATVNNNNDNINRNNSYDTFDLISLKIFLVYHCFQQFENLQKLLNNQFKNQHVAQTLSVNFQVESLSPYP